MVEEIEQGIICAKKDVANTKILHKLIHEVKPKYFGKNSILENVLNKIKFAPKEEKKNLGSLVKMLKNTLEEIFKTRADELEKTEIDARLRHSAIDASMSTSFLPRGSLHPLHLAANSILKIFQRYGCKICTDTEITNTWYNFDSLNIAEDHPARQMHDTFYLKGIEKQTNKNYVLRTHATGVDIKIAIQNGTPVRSVAFGKVFRRDLDNTHSPMFHQFDILFIDKGIHLGHLKFILELFLADFFETDEVNLRLRPSFFPFTEPSVEIDICYSVQNNKVVLDKKGDKFMEILGCGVLRPIVLQNCNINPAVYTGIAAGIGLERLVMLKYGFKDIRDFFKSDLLWMESSEEEVLFRNSFN
ncbi:MAG: phenylalanine--tRNA ligase subunit alpha [Alphaproteobacteria bacterium]|nr:phenylalanine--tRNA ligase subunit alpha [Rickettsiales bacterium]